MEKGKLSLIFLIDLSTDSTILLCFNINEIKFMKIDLTRVLINEHDEPIQDTSNDNKPLTVKNLIIGLLFADDKGNASQKMDRYLKAMEVKKAESEVEITTEEALYLKDTAALRYMGLIAGQFSAIIEGKI